MNEQGFEQLSTLKNYSMFCIGQKKMKQLAFFIRPSRLCWKIISWLLEQIFNAIHLIFTGYGISTLECCCWNMGVRSAPNGHERDTNANPTSVMLQLVVADKGPIQTTPTAYNFIGF